MEDNVKRIADEIASLKKTISEIPSPCMTAQQFEKKATTIGLKKGFFKDFQFVESMDARICCLLKTNKAIMLARNCNIETEESPGGYLIYFLA